MCGHLVLGTAPRAKTSDAQGWSEEECSGYNNTSCPRHCIRLRRSHGLLRRRAGNTRLTYSFEDLGETRFTLVDHFNGESLWSHEMLLVLWSFARTRSNAI